MSNFGVPMKLFLRCGAVLVCGCVALGCSGDDGGDDDEAGAGDTPLDVNAPPVTGGTWNVPGTAVTWQWQLSGTVNTTYAVDVYDIDLFEADAALIAQLQAAGRRVLCYFSAGSFENWRPDASSFEAAALGSPLDGWEGERWLDVRHPNVHAIMRSRLDLAVTKGCDGVEPDNMDGYDNDSGFNMNATAQLAFNRFIANEAHTRNLTVALKNDGAQAAELVSYYDLSLNEECHALNDCGDLAPFSMANKAILNAEYPGDLAAAQAQKASVCARAATAHTRTLLLPLNLDDAFRVSCD